MDGQRAEGVIAGQGLPLADRIAQLDRLEGVFAKLAGEFPANGRISAQLDAVQRAGSILRRLPQTGRFPRDFRQEIEEVRGIFLSVGARDADLERWGLV